MNQRSILIFILLSIAVFTALTVYGDARAIVNSILVLSPMYWLAATGLTIAHIGIRLVRWNYYLKVLDIPADPKTSALTFLSGLAMIMIPGRVGELGKSFFLKQKLDIPIRLTAPVVVAERVIDVTSVLFLGMWGLIFIPFGWTIILVTLAALGFLVIFLRSRNGMSILVRLPIIRRWEPILSDSGQAFQTLFSPKSLVVGFVLGGLAWFTLGFASWVVFRGLQVDIQIPTAVSIFSAATMLGSISMLPGGLISTEGSMLAMLTKVGLGGTLASAAILIIRVVTLWVSVLIGVVALVYLQRHQPVRAAEPGGKANRFASARLLDRAEGAPLSGADS